MTGTEFDAIWTALFRIRDELMRLEEAHPQDDRGAGPKESIPPPDTGPAMAAGGTYLGPATGQGGEPVRVPATGQAAAPRNPERTKTAFGEWLNSPEGTVALQNAVRSAQGGFMAEVPVHDNGTPLSVGDRVDRGGLVLTYTGPCKNQCGRAAFTLAATLNYPPGSYACYRCWKEARR